MSAIDLLRIGLLIALVVVGVLAIVEYVKIRIEDRRIKRKLKDD